MKITKRVSERDIGKVYYANGEAVVDVAVEFDLDEDYTQGQLVAAYLEALERDGTLGTYPLDQMIAGLDAHGCPPEILALVEDWHDGRLSVHDLLLLGAT